MYVPRVPEGCWEAGKVTEGACLGDPRGRIVAPSKAKSGNFPRTDETLVNTDR